MKFINYLKSFLYFIIPFFSLLLISSIFYYFDILSNEIFRYIKIIIIIISCFISGFKIGKSSLQKGYLKGITLGGLISLLFFIITLFTNNFKIYQIIYYLIIIIVTTICSILGINKKNQG